MKAASTAADLNELECTDNNIDNGDDKFAAESRSSEPHRELLFEEQGMSNATEMGARICLALAF